MKHFSQWAGRCLVSLLTALLFAGTPAQASDDNSCSTASGQGSHACTFPDGQIVVETNLIDRTIDDGGPARTKSVLAGDTLVHVGVSRSAELIFGWTPFDYERTLLSENEKVVRSQGIGDVTFGGKLALMRIEDAPIGIALQSVLNFGVGGRKLGSKGVGGEILIPITYSITSALSLEVTPEADYTGNRADNNRHLEFGGTVGLDWTLSDAVSFTGEYATHRDQDPAFQRIKQTGALSVAWKPGSLIEFNLGYAIGLTRQSPRGQLLAGLTLHFLTK